MGYNYNILLHHPTGSYRCATIIQFKLRNYINRQINAHLHKGLAGDPYNKYTIWLLSFHHIFDLQISFDFYRPEACRQPEYSLFVENNVLYGSVPTSNGSKSLFLFFASRWTHLSNVLPHSSLQYNKYGYIQGKHSVLILVWLKI